MRATESKLGGKKEFNNDLIGFNVQVGIGKEFSIHDETLVDAIRRCTNANNGNANNAATVMDCRAYAFCLGNKNEKTNQLFWIKNSYASAMANRARGMGTEDEARYVNVKVCVCL